MPVTASETGDYFREIRGKTGSEREYGREPLAESAQRLQFRSLASQESCVNPFERRSSSKKAYVFVYAMRSPSWAIKRA